MSVLLTFKLHHWKYEVYNAAVSQSFWRFVHWRSNSKSFASKMIWIELCVLIIIRQFIRRRNMSVDTTRAPYREKMGTQFATAQLKLKARPIWLSEEMSLQTLFKLVTCWCAPNTVRQVVPRGRACDGERMLAELQMGPRDEQNAVCRWPEGRTMTDWNNGNA